MNVEDTVPTIGWESTTFLFSSFKFNLIDISGQSKYRDLWTTLYIKAEAIVFVIDSADKVRLQIVKAEIDLLLENEIIKNSSIPILFFANKIDIETALKPWEIEEELDLNSIKNRIWAI